MPDLGPHAVFIVWAYVGVALATIALVIWVATGARRVRTQLAALEAQGIRRRSDGPAA
jgi:heme exporter protein D